MLRLLTLGRCGLLIDSLGKTVNRTTQPKRFALLAFLAVDAGGGFHRRDTLMALFWPELDESHARAALRKALHHLRQLLGDAVIVTRGAEEVGLNQDALWCDALALNSLAAEGKYVEAVALYEGDFLPGLHLSDAPVFERWTDAPRQRLRQVALDSALELARAARVTGSTEVAVRWARRAVEIAPLDDVANRALIDALVANSECAAAVSVYDQFSELLARELEVGPPDDLRAIVKHLRETVPPELERSGHIGSASRTHFNQRSAMAAVDVRTIRRRTGMRVTRIALGLIAAASAMGLMWWGAGQRGATVPDALSVAVLPLESVSGDSAQRYVGEGVQNALIAELSRVPSLRVIARASANRSAAKGRSISEIARYLSVGSIVTGEFKRTRDSIAVRLRLVDRNDRQLWTASYQSPVRELPILGADAAAAIAEELRAAGKAGSAHAAPRIEPDSKAFDAWLQGSYHAGRRTAHDTEQCIQHGNEAVAIDPRYAKAYELLAQCYNLLSFLTDAPPRMMFEQAQATSRRALELDDSLSAAHAAFAYALAAGDWNWPAAEREYLRAAQLDPRSPFVHQEFAFFLSWIGRHEAAIAEARLAEQFDPTSPETAARVAVVYYLAGRHDEAIAEGRRAAALDANFMFAYERLHWAYEAKGMARDAVVAAEQAARIAGPTDSRRRAFVAHAYAMAGRRAEARAILDQLLERRRTTYVSPIAIAAVYVGLGEKSTAIAWLERAYEVHDGGLVLLATFPLWAPLHGEPGYESLRQRLKL